MISVFGSKRDNLLDEFSKQIKIFKWYGKGSILGFALRPSLAFVFSGKTRKRKTFFPGKSVEFGGFIETSDGLGAIPAKLVFTLHADLQVIGFNLYVLDSKSNPVKEVYAVACQGRFPVPEVKLGMHVTEL